MDGVSCMFRKADARVFFYRRWELDVTTVANQTLVYYLSICCPVHFLIISVIANMDVQLRTADKGVILTVSETACYTEGTGFVGPYEYGTETSGSIIIGREFLD
jgi:hypothetical protein